MALVSEDDIRRAVSHHALQAGRDYVAGGRVRSLSVSGDGRTVQASVNGSAESPYLLSIRLDPGRDGRSRIIGACSCPVGSNCKHVAAALFAARGQAAEPALRRSEPAPATTDVPLSLPLEQWLQSLQDAREDDAREYPESVRQRLFYILKLAPAPQGPSVLMIDAIGVRLRKDGSATPTGKDYSRAAFETSSPKFIRSEDRAVLRRLWSSSSDGPEDDSEAVETLRRAIATGRSRWGSVDGPEVSEGDARPGRLLWHLAPDGSQYWMWRWMQA